MDERNRTLTQKGMGEAAELPHFGKAAFLKKNVGYNRENSVSSSRYAQHDHMFFQDVIINRGSLRGRLSYLIV